MNYLLLKADGKLYCTFVDNPHIIRTGSNKLKYEAAKAEAIANALEIVNPEILPTWPKPHINGYILPKNMEVGELYPWNGGAEVEEICNNRTCAEMNTCQSINLENCKSKKFVRLSLPDNKQPLQWPSERSLPSKEAELKQAVKKYIFHMDKFFGDVKVGQPPDLKELRELMKDEPHQPIDAECEKPITADRVEKETQWISVETQLPRSNTQVLAIGNKGKHWFVGFYTAGRDVEVSSDEDFDSDCAGCEDQDYCYLKPGWYEEEETPRGEFDYTYVHRNVTHWMPLPNPPIK